MGLSRFWWWLVAVVVALVILRLLCPPTADACPDHDVPIAKKFGIGNITQVRLAGEITLIPEFHDCQRLISEQDDSKFGTLAAIWVSEHLEQLPDSLLVLNPPGTWHHPSGDSGWTLVDTLGWGPDTEPGRTILQGLPFAVIHAWDGNYRWLGIRQGWNCLYLLPAATGIGYEARMVHVGDNADCYDPQKSTSLVDGTPLRVRPLLYPGLGEGDYPAVGRWDSSPKHGLMYIGLKCGAAWCEITGVNSPGVPDQGSSAQYRDGAVLDGTTAALPGAGTRVLAIKGWYDEQRLALVTNSGGMQPSDFRAIVVPDPGLGQADFSGSRWVAAGWAAVEKPLAAYQTKLNIVAGALPPGGAPIGGTDIAICKSTTTTCDFGTAPAPVCSAGSDGARWYARLTPRNGGATIYTCMDRKGHEGIGRTIPGTARWRWVADDEKLWFRCEQGCCTTR